MLTFLRGQRDPSSGKIVLLTDQLLRRGGVAQLAEQRTHKPRVTRSIRVTATKFILDPIISLAPPNIVAPRS